MTASPGDRPDEPLLVTPPADRRRLSDGLVAALCYAVPAALVLWSSAAVVEAVTVSIAGRQAAMNLRPITAIVTVLGAVTAFLIAFWRVYHEEHPEEPAAGPPEP